MVKKFNNKLIELLLLILKPQLKHKDIFVLTKRY